MESGASLAYLGVYIAAAVEGEIVFITASIAAASGQLNPWGVWIAGALGGSTGDQFYFYAFRGALGPWLDRFPRVARRRRALSGLVRRYAFPLTAACRFLPGLRVAIPAACATCGVRPLLFSTVNLVSAFVWAAGILGLITWAGSGAIGAARNWAIGVSAALVLIAFFALGRVKFGADDASASATPGCDPEPPGPRTSS
jgi:membrane protein DedA with SNARE-associated domain